MIERETWSLTPTEEHKLWVFQNGMPRRIFGARLASKLRHAWVRKACLKKQEVAQCLRPLTLVVMAHGNKKGNPAWARDLLRPEKDATERSVDGWVSRETCQPNVMPSVQNMTVWSSILNFVSWGKLVNILLVLKWIITQPTQWTLFH